MKPQFTNKISNEDYHAGPGESKSLLDLAHKSPVHYRARKLSITENVATPAQALGTAFHALLLEPKEFAKQYTLALRQLDVPDAIDDREVLVAMIQDLNAARLPKLPTGGTKADQVARILDAQQQEPGADPCDAYAAETLEGMKGAELKAILDGLNETRLGLLSTSGSRHDLAEILRANGRPVTLWSDVKAEWLENNGHRIVLEPETWDQLHRMRDAVMADPAAAALMNAPGVAEYSAYWTDPVTGLLCRCRPDWWRLDGILVDVKTTLDASPEGFAKSISNFRYHVQHPFYLDGMNLMRQQSKQESSIAEAKAFVFLAVEKTACVVEGVAMGVGVYVLDQESVALGRAEYRRDLRTIAECTASGHWPGYGGKIQSISLPTWKLAQGADLIYSEDAA